MAVACGKVVFVCETESGRQITQFDCGSIVADISLSADGTHIAIAKRSPTIDVYNVKSGTIVSRLNRAGGPSFLINDPQEHLAFYPDGTKLVSIGAKKRLYVSDVKSGRWDYIQFIKYGICNCAVSPDGNHVVLFGEQNRRELSGHVTMFRVNRGLQPLWTKWHNGDGRVRCGAFSPDSKLLATCGAGDGLRVWQVGTGELVTHMEGEPLSIAFCDASHIVAASESQIEVIDIATGATLVSKRVDKQLNGFAASADGSVVVAYGSEAAIDVWSVTLDKTRR